MPKTKVRTIATLGSDVWRSARNLALPSLCLQASYRHLTGNMHDSMYMVGHYLIRPYLDLSMMLLAGLEFVYYHLTEVCRDYMRILGVFIRYLQPPHQRHGAVGLGKRDMVDATSLPGCTNLLPLPCV